MCGNGGERVNLWNQIEVLLFTLKPAVCLAGPFSGYIDVLYRIPAMLEFSVYVCLFTHTHITHTEICTYIYIYTNIHKYIHTYMHTYNCVYIYIHFLVKLEPYSKQCGEVTELPWREKSSHNPPTASGSAELFASRNQWVCIRAAELLWRA